MYADATKRTTESAATSPATMTATAPTRLATPTGSFHRARGSRRASTTPQTTPVATCATRYRTVIATESVTPAITYIHSGPVPRTARPTAVNGAKNSVSPRPSARSAASTRPGRPAPPDCGRTHARLAAKRNRRQVRTGATTPASWPSSYASAVHSRIRFSRADAGHRRAAAAKQSGHDPLHDGHHDAPGARPAGPIASTPRGRSFACSAASSVRALARPSGVSR